MVDIASYGAWKSPITSDLIVAKTISLGQIIIEDDTIYWTEMRPAEKGRIAIVRRNADGKIEDLLPEPYNARTRVHEYGGGSYLVHAGVIYFSNFVDQRLYKFVPGTKPEPISPPVDLRYADGIMDAARGRIICVREDHTVANREAVNTIVSIRPDGADLESGGQVLVSGYDFFSSPRLSPDGTHLAWLSWNHPNMPWDGTELWVASIQPDGSLAHHQRIAGGKSESIFQPEWSPDGTLYFISDRTGWWNFYRWQDGKVQPLHPLDAEFGEPQWVFGLSTYAFESASRLVCAYTYHGHQLLAVLDTGTFALQTIPTPYSDFGSVAALPGRAVFLAGSPTFPLSLVRWDLANNQPEILRQAMNLDLDLEYLSTPQTIEFPTEQNRTAYGIYYAPRNRDFQAPQGELPPLIVMSHGGPTSAAGTALNLSIQYWTSRGFAVVDVNYGGSTGYGRAYRQRLNGQWGIVDVDDCVNAALYLARAGKADKNRLAIRGGSAGGYTTLCALTFRKVFHAGASHYGVSDAEALAKDTHKFESRYLDSMIGPYPQERELYIQRSPIHFVDQLDCALILFQGSEDRVVPPAQSRTMFEAVRAKGLPVAYLEFEGEQHGFRQAKNIKRALDAELYFYGKIFGFQPDGPIEPMVIENIQVA